MSTIDRFFFHVWDIIDEEAQLGRLERYLDLRYHHWPMTWTGIEIPSHLIPTLTAQRRRL